MKRHPQLQSLSRQHHNGLMMALLITKGVRKNAETKIINDFISVCWNNDLQAHFELEENILLPSIDSKSFDKELIQQLITEHRQLRVFINKASTNSATDRDQLEFAKLLEQHIRFEERIFFPKVEELLSENEMLLIGDQLQHRAPNNCIEYPIKFWE